jgi:DNA-binding response OmpR family regulator
MRDLNRLLLAEDERELAHGLREVLETVGGFEVWITWLGADVIRLLKKTHAAWLVLDLELEDGYSGRVVKEIRRLWGDEVYIVVLSGHYNRYPEHELLGNGADNFLRKPYSPKSLISQIARARVRLEGLEFRSHNGVMLKIGDGVLDLNRGAYTTGKGDEELFLSDSQLKLLRILTSARDENGWVHVNRGTLMLNLWAEEHANDPFVYSNRLRQLKARTKSLFGLDPIEIRKGGHTSKWRLKPSVVELISE